MTPREFCHWLDGYLQCAEKPDPEAIKAKARQIVGPPVAPQPWQPIGPGIWPEPNRYPRIGDVGCGTADSTSVDAAKPARYGYQL